MADVDPLKNCKTCQYGEHFSENGEPSSYLCTKTESVFLGIYFWEDEDEIWQNFICHVEEFDDETNLQKMQRMQTDISERVLSQARKLSGPTQGDHWHGEGS
ncbi:MAG: hypothetical protein KAS38_14075 [Anaerolineales bacterium]|nr:hypothetical protein [Anaerolineales bacterium]